MFYAYNYNILNILNILKIKYKKMLIGIFVSTRFTMAETQTCFHNLSMKVHQVSRNDLRESRKTWARENYH